MDNRLEVQERRRSWREYGPSGCTVKFIQPLEEEENEKKPGLWPVCGRFVAGLWPGLCLTCSADGS